MSKININRLYILQRWPGLVPTHDLGEFQGKIIPFRQKIKWDVKSHKMLNVNSLLCQFVPFLSKSLSHYWTLNYWGTTNVPAHRKAQDTMS